MVFQQFNLLANSTVLGNVAVPLRLQGRRGRERAMQMLEFVRMADHRDKHPAQLSGGEKQRVAIARAVVSDPKLLLADEPTGSLDQRTSGEVMELFEDLNSDGLTLVIITHDQAVAERAGRSVRISDGRLSEVA